MSESGVLARRLVLAAAILAVGLACEAQSGAKSSIASPTANDVSLPSLAETHWNLVELDGRPVLADQPENRPYIYLHTDRDKLSGSGGCNRLFGSYDLSGSSLQFHSVAATRMACPGNSMEHEADLLDALKLVTGFQISGNVLQLRVDDRILAQFQSEKLK